MAVATESRTSPRTEPRIEKGISLSRGPALILGTILLAAGLYFIYKQHFFPKLSNFPSGHAAVKAKVLFGLFGANGWTGMLTAIAGGLLLFGAAQHFLAKTMSLIVGVVLAAAAIIGLVNSGNVLGLAAANHLTELGWGVAAVILLLNSLIPRRTHTVEPAYGEAGYRGRAYDERPGRRHAGVEGAAVGAGAGAAVEHERTEHREPVEDRRAAEGDGAGTVARDPGPAGEETAVQNPDPAGAPTGETAAQANGGGSPRRSWLSRLRPGSGR